MAGAVLGSMGPIIFKTLQVDPAFAAGPFESALQDVFGIMTYLLLSSLLLP
jgi:Mg/Co/Ni transporter MgtE